MRTHKHFKHPQLLSLGHYYFFAGETTMVLKEKPTSTVSFPPNHLGTALCCLGTRPPGGGGGGGRQKSFFG